MLTNTSRSLAYSRAKCNVCQQQPIQSKRCILEPAARGFLAIARRCRLKKSIRQRFAFALKIQQMACAMIKPAGSHNYLESAGTSLKDNQQEMAPSVPRTRAAAALRMKPIALDNQDRTIRRLRAQLATERRGLAATKKELEETRVALEASHKVIAGLTEIGLSMSKKIERMKVKKKQVRANHVECHQEFQDRIHEAEGSMQAQHLIIEALVDEKDSLLQTIHGLQEANNAPAPFDGDWEEEPEEEPEEEEIEDIPLGEGEIDDE
ncbi:nuclear matrix constituent protein 1-like protein [Dorcoceras hygrometricum]|uniref:Nuclear matrix constituent protein 1-like protein n=1 Tax=Dorcoceras hygrometricum TaxID=472368 RepID=A0A2Z7BT58_9LAMI|nr:nuclear matrix constituent protein 1-like protein [Dorcoceras hygrometricum]